MTPCLDHAEAIAAPPKPPGVSSLKLKKAQVEDRFFRQNCQVPLEPPPSPTIIFSSRSLMLAVL